jgi:hypothetical protein
MEEEKLRKQTEQVKVQVPVEPILSDADKEELKRFFGGLGAEGADPDGVYKKVSDELSKPVETPIKPELDQPSYEVLKSTLATPTSNTHTVNPNLQEALAAIAQLLQTTHSTHIIHVQTVSDGGDPVAASGEGYATGGYLGGGWGGGDRLHIMAEMGEYINNKFSVKAYGRHFFELLNAQAIPPSLIRELMSGSPQGYKDGGMVEPPPSGSADTVVMELRLGDEAYPVEIRKSSRGVFEQFVDRYGKEKLKRGKH